MKIGIITFHESVNYGALLQAYALSSYLQKQGHDVYIIDYNRRASDKGILLLLHKINVAIRMVLKKPFFLFSYIRNRLTKASQNSFIGGNNEKTKIFDDLFRSFRRKNFRLTDFKYRFPLELRMKPPKMDAYIAGSDQIWGHGQTSFSDAYFLNFGPKGIRRIAYAPSFGRPTLDKSWNKELCRKIKRFDAVSVREKSGIDIIQKACRRNAVKVLDPTLLLDDYSQITSNVNTEPFIFIYRLKQSEQLKSNFLKLTKNISDELNLTTKVIAPMDKLGDDENEILVGIEDFLGHVKNATFMITNSFHGTVFAILNKVNFICCARTGTTEGQNDRMIGLLEELNLLERYTNLDENINYKQYINNQINWEDVYSRLNKLREISINFLNEALI